MATSFGRIILPLVPVLLGCSSSAEARPCPVVAEAATSAPIEPPAVIEPRPASSAVGLAVGSEPAAGEKDPPASAPVTVATGQRLPELRLKITGMHIGGGPNDSETKRPFMDAIEAGFDQMRDCYRKTEEPGKGGTYGVDLRVDRVGGHPTVQAVRTAMKGDALRKCLESSFLGLSFGKPAKGPTVLSVSVNFSLGE